jgi:hypothetical protein
MAGKAVQVAFETESLGHCGPRDTLHAGTRKGGDRVSRRTFIGTHAKAGFAKRHDRKTPIMAADLKNGRVRPSMRRTAPYRDVFLPIPPPHSVAPTTATNANARSSSRTAPSR